MTILTYLILIFLVPTISFAQPEGNAQQVVEQSDWDKLNADKPYIALVNEYDVHVNSDYSYEEVYHARVKVQNQEAQDLEQWPVYYNKAREQIIEIKAYTETTDGKKIDAKDIDDTEVYVDAAAFSDMRVKVVKFPKISVGNIIDVTIKSKTNTKEIPLSFWHTVALPVIPTKYARYVYSFPTSLPIKFKAYHNETKPLIEEKNGRVSYTFVLEKTMYQPDEDYAPPTEEMTGLLTFSSLEDWTDVANWYREAIAKSTVDDADISVKTLELVTGKATEREKAKAVLEFLQDNFKFVSINPGDHGVMLHSTKTIFANKYGDTKDLALIARQMLAIVGIKADICLFSGEFNGNPQNSLPNPNVFDHLILEITLDGKKYFVDPQAKGFDIGQLPPSYDNAYVMVIGDANYRFDQLPISDEAFNQVESSSTIDVDENGTGLFDVSVRLPFESSVQFKEQWVGASPANQEKFFEQLQKNFTPGGKMIDRQISGVNDRYSRVSFILKYEAPNAYPKVNDMILLKEADQSSLSDLPNGPRQNAIFFPTNSVVTNKNTYHIPQGYVIDSVPEDYNLDSDFMQVHVAYKKVDKGITVEATYRTKRVLLDAKRFEDVKKFRDDLLKKSDQYIVLKKKSNVNPQAKDWIKNQ